MKRRRLSLAAGILTIVFAVTPGLAGQMPQGVTSPPPPPPDETSITGDMPGGVTDASATGDMPLGITSEIDPWTELTLGLLRSVFSLF